MEPLLDTEVMFQSLVQEISTLIQEDIIITNQSGIIVASTESTRVGDYHEGAYLAMKNQMNMVMTKELAKTLQGVRRGLTLPIIIDQKPIAVLGITGEPEDVESYAKLIQKTAELFIESSSVQMTQEKKLRNIELFVFDWLSEVIQGDMLIKRGEFFRLPIRKYEQVISLHLPFVIDRLSYKEILALRQIWDREQQAIFVRWGEGKLLILDQQSEQEPLLQKLKEFQRKTEHIIGKEVYIGVGQSASYNKLHQSLQQAERACDIAEQERQIIFEEALRFEMIQHEVTHETKEKFIARTIAPIENEAILMKTLESWFECDRSIQTTASSLHIHKNTLYYRLAQIEKKTKLSLSNTEEMLLLYIGLKFLQRK